MKSTRLLPRLANRKTFSKNVCALTADEIPPSTIPSSFGFAQDKRSLTTFKVNAKSASTKHSSYKQSAAEGESNVLVSKFGEIPACKTAFHKKVLLKILDHAAEDPNRVALILAENPFQSVTYLKLHRQTYALASFLAHRGIGHQGVCCTVLPNCLEYVPAYLGTMMVGGVNMGTDERCTEVELENAFQSSKCKAIITHSKLLTKVMAAAKKSSLAKVIICITSSSDEVLPEGVVAWEDTMGFPTTDFDNFKYSADDPAFVQYHSRVPQSHNGIVMSHKNISTMLDINTEYFSKYVYKRMFYDNKEGVYEPYSEHAILSMPFHHIFGFAHLNRILLEGITGVIMENSEPRHYLEMLHNYRPKVVAMLPEMANFLLHDSMVQNYDLKSLEVVFIGGAPFPQKLMEEFLLKFKHVRFMVPFYGWPECGISFMSPMKRRHGTATILSTFQQKIVCPQTGETLPFGNEGEVCLRSSTMMQGYMNNPEATLKVIDADGWFHTGDVGVLDHAGQTVILDRAKVTSAEQEGDIRKETDAEKHRRRL